MPEVENSEQFVIIIIMIIKNLNLAFKTYLTNKYNTLKKYESDLTIVSITKLINTI